MDGSNIRPPQPQIITVLSGAQRTYVLISGQPSAVPVDIGTGHIKCEFHSEESEDKIQFIFLCPEEVVLKYHLHLRVHLIQPLGIGLINPPHVYRPACCLPEACMPTHRIELPFIHYVVLSTWTTLQTLCERLHAHFCQKPR